MGNNFCETNYAGAGAGAGTVAGTVAGLEEDLDFTASITFSPISFIGAIISLFNVNVLYMKKQTNRIPKRITKFIKY